MDNFTRAVLNTCDEIGSRLQTIDRVARLSVVAGLLDRDKLSGDFRRYYNRMRLKVDRVRSSGGSALHVVFLGNFNAGKSSLINALGSVHTRTDGSACDMGRTTDILPTDDCITLLQYGDSRQSYRQRVEGGEVAVEVFDYPFLRNVVLVDTPGVGNVPREDELINDYLDEVDLLVLVSPATMPINEADQRLLQTKFDRFPSAVGLLVVTRIALECPAEGFRIDAVDEVKAKQVEERLRSYMRARFPDHIGRLPMSPPHTQSLWLVDSKCKYNIRELADYLFNRFGREEQSIALRRSLMRDRLALYARETAEGLVAPVSQCLGKASGQLNHLVEEIDRSAAPLGNLARTHADVLVNLLKRRFDGPSTKNAFAPFEFPGPKEVREALLVPEMVREAVRNSVFEREKKAREIVETMEDRCLLRHEEKLRLLLKESDTLLTDWVEVQSLDHNRALQTAYAERLRAICERHYRSSTPPTLQRLLAEPAVGTAQPDPAKRERARQLEFALVAEAIEAELRRGCERFCAELHAALLGEESPGGPLGEIGTTRLTEWRQDVQTQAVAWGGKAARALDTAPPKRLERLAEEARGEVLEVLKGFAPDFAQNIRTLFDARQSEADRLGLDQRLADLEAISHSDFLHQFDEALQPAVRQFVEDCVGEARPLVQEFQDGVRETAAQSDGASGQAATRIAEHAENAVREQHSRAIWNDLLAGLDWRRLTDINLRRTADDHRAKLLQNIEAPVLQIERDAESFRRRKRENLTRLLLLYGLLPLILFLSFVGWEAASRIEVAWWKTVRDWIWWGIPVLMVTSLAGCWARIRAMSELMRETQRALDDRVQRHILELERHVAEAHDNLRRAAAERLNQLRTAIKDVLSAGRKRFQDRLGEFDARLQVALHDWNQASAVQCERLLQRINEVKEKLDRGGVTHGESFQRQVSGRFLSVTDRFLERHLAARKQYLNGVNESLRLQKAQLDEVAQFLTEPPAESALAQATAKPALP